MESISSTGPVAKDTKPQGRRRASAKDTLHVKKKAEPAEAASASDLTPHIATAAYFLAEQRGFTPGHELDDWLEAERLVRMQS